MRIEQLEIINFRQYKNVTFDFPKTVGKKDMHIILGQNGEGKTNMLNAITWCLYGRELHLGDKYQAQERINNSYVEELRLSQKQYGDVSVMVELSSGDDSQQHIRIFRKSKYAILQTSVRDIESSFEVMERTTGDWNPILDSDECNNIVHRYVPEEINQYIFFDGEQLEKYFQDIKKEKIQSGIEELTQASDLQKAINAFEKYIQSDLSPKLRNSSDVEVQNCQNEVEKIQLSIDKINQYIATYKVQITKCESEIEQLTSYIGSSTNVKDKIAELERLENESDNLKQKQHDLWSSLMGFTREYYQYLAIYPAMKEFYDFIEEQDKAGNLPPKIDKSYLTMFLDSPKCLICGSPMTPEHKKDIKKLLEKLSVGSESAAELNRASSAIKAYFNIIKKYPSEKKKYMDDMANVKAEKVKNDTAYAKLHEDLKSIPDATEIAKAIDKREECKKQSSDLYVRIGAEKTHLETESKKLDEANDRLAKALESNKQFESIKKKIDYCKESKVLLSQIKNEILEKCRLDMQKETFNIFKKLLWKKDAFSKVVIDEDYSFKLIDNYGNQTLGSSSAGERVLLALSFTLALQKVSKHDSLLYIDTPVGRVDNNNRKNFMEALMNVADDKQVILTFTPSEYNHAIQEVLNESYSSFKTLVMSNNITTLN